MTPSDNCIALVKQFEGCKLSSYQDIRGIWTIAYGHTANVKEGDTCSQIQADDWLAQDLQTACNCILNGLDCALTQNEMDALTSLIYNIGCANFLHSTLRFKLSKGDYEGAAPEFLKWDHSGGKVVQGLLNRRMAEHKLFVS